MQQQPVIDLTGESTEEEAFELTPAEECTICFRRVWTAVTYACCRQRCCLACYRQMHVWAPRDDCPYCRAADGAHRVEIEPLRLSYLTRGGFVGHLSVSAFAPVQAVRQAIAEQGHRATALLCQGARLSDALCLLHTYVESSDLLIVH